MMSNEIGQATREFDGKRERIIQSMQSTVSLSCFGRNSLAQCYKLKAIFQSSAFLSFLKSLGRDSFFRCPQFNGYRWGRL
nr:MAG TPA: hypothetical protein [Caudoviricetes sp.]